MRILCVCTIVLLFGCPALAENPKAETPAAAALEMLSAEYDAANKETRANYRSVKNDDRIDEEAQKYRAKVRKLGDEYSGRFLAIAEQHPKDAAAVDALVRAAQLGAGESTSSEKALTLLERDHLQDGKITEVINDLAYTKWAGADKFLRAVLDKSPSREARGNASYWLAYRLREKANDELTGSDADKATKEAEVLLQVVIEKFSDVPGGPRGDLGKRATIALAELQRLAVGRVAPEIEGEDGDGKHFKLSDYRGKVVVLDFWGHWCPDCRGVYPKQRALVKRFEGKPFALVGVNSDEDKDALKKVLEKRGVTWRYWWDGGSRTGPIASAWNIQGWPTIYVIDQKGIIRHKGHEELAEKLDQLVAELLKDSDAVGSVK